MSDVSVQSVGSKNVLGRKPSKAIQKGAIIGACTGGAISGAISAIANKSLKLLKQDEFCKQVGESMIRAIDKCIIENTSGDTYANLVNNINYLDRIELAHKELKKAIPVFVLKVAGIGLAIGAGIGLIVKLVKDNKAKKQAEKA